MHLIMKIILSVIFIQLSGCTAILWGENSVADTKIKERTLISDEVTAAFYYENLSASAIQGKTQVRVEIPRDGVAFKGENIYILTTGAKELLALDKLSTQVTLVTGYEKFDGLRLKLDMPRGNDLVMHFSDALVLQVNESDSNLTTQDIDDLKKRGSGMRVEGMLSKYARKGLLFPEIRTTVCLIIARNWLKNIMWNFILQKTQLTFILCDWQQTSC